MQVLAAANDALRGPREVGGTNDVTVSNGVNLVDPEVQLPSGPRAPGLGAIACHVRRANSARPPKSDNLGIKYVSLI